MITVEYRDNVWAPTLKCDVCLETINDIQASYVYWMVSLDDPVRVTAGPSIVHRYPDSPCDKAWEDKHPRWEVNEDGTPGKSLGMVLTHATHEHLLGAMENAKCDVPAALERAHEYWSWS